MSLKARLLTLALAVCTIALSGTALSANPIVVITNTANPFTNYLPEILRAEGMNGFDSVDLGQVSSQTLAGYDVAILGQASLTSAQASMFSTWVNGGGNLIAMRPDAQLAGLLGLTGPSGTLADAYLLVNTSSRPGSGIVGQTIQYHGAADRYTLSGATSIATLYSSASQATSNPAVTMNTAGLGNAAAFTYDLARSVVYTRQGNPAWSAQERDGTAPIRSDDLYFGGTQPDYVDLNKVAIPQADEQQRLLVNLIYYLTSTKRPIPRFWYLPKGLKAAVVMTGDDHGTGGTGPRFDLFTSLSPAGCSVADWECVRSTSYVYPGTSITNPANYVNNGFEIGLHVSTNCGDFFGFADLDSYYQTQLAQWASSYPTLTAPKTNRTHCIAWSDYDTQPQVELSHNIRFDTNYYYWPGSWIQDRPGLFTGSGMPMRFMTAAGNLVDVYQATTQMTDESNQSFPATINALLANAVGSSGYYGVFTANMHTDLSNTNAQTWSQQIVNSAQSSGVPVVSSLQMLQWLDGRNNSTIDLTSWAGNTLTFSITAASGARNLRAMLPLNMANASLSSLTQGSTAVNFTVQTIKGVQYAMFAASTGTYTAVYGGVPTFSISGAVTAAATSSGTSVSVSGPVTATVLVDSSGTYSLSGLPAGTYSVTPSKTGLTFTPASQNITITTDNVSGVNFTATRQCPCSIWSSSTVPAVPAANDTSAIEVGVRFQSDVNGSITGIRFYKGTGNTGTHIGNLWTNSGTLLATATFSNETSTGWQEVSFSQPVAITANTTYVASYHTDTGRYAADSGYFGSAFDNPPLHALANGASAANGVYRYGSTGFPTNTFQSTNYWVDVVLATGPLSSISGTISGPGGNGATVTLSGAASATATADASGNYTFNNLSNGTYTVTPSKSGATFTPANQTITINNASQTGVNFSSTIPTFSISGTITGAGGNAATVTLSGSSSATVTADSSGAYSFSGLPNGSYTVTPSKSGYTFTPTSQNVTISGASATAVDFSSTAAFNLSGTISGPGASGATVSLTGTSSATTTSDASGNFSFTNLVNGSYTVTPTQLGYTYAPASQAVTINGASVSGVTFTSTLNAAGTCPCTIWTPSAVPSVSAANDPNAVELGVKFRTDVAGTITGIRFYKGTTNTGTHTGSLWSSAGTLLATATFINETASGWQQVNFSQPVAVTANTTYVASYHTNAGNYAVDQNYFASAVDNPPLHALSDAGAPGNGVYAYGANSTFPNSTYLSSNYWVDVVFSTGTQTFSISGTISGTGGNGATVTLGGAGSATTTADATGNYTFSGLSNGSYTVTPSKSGFSFTPASANATVNGANVTGVNFTSAAQTFSISGTISGTGGNGATVTLSGAGSATTTADASGNYTFTGLANGSYTVTPSKSGFTYTPASQNATVNGANVTALNFSSAAANTFSISGIISGAGGNAATVTLSGAASATTTADASGNYSFTGLANGSYTVTPSKSGATYTPASQNVTVNGANVTAVNFSSTLQTFTLSGTVSGAGGNGATVTLSGSSTATTTADASGNYSFTVPNGSYTVTPSKSGFVFTPASQNATVNGANVTGVNFTSAAQTFTISGTISGTGGNLATVSLTGSATATTTADASGNYSFAGLANGSYTVTPSKAGFTFTPASQSVTISGANATANFASAVQTFSITGTISGAGGNAATVKLTGAATASVVANASGVYTFSGLVNGSYTVTPTKAGYAFTPVNQAVTVNGANVSGVNFSSTATGLAVDVTVFTDRSTNGSSIASPAFTTKSANELLLAFIATDGARNTAQTVTSVTGGGLTWTLVRRSNTQAGTAEIWRAFAPAVLTSTAVTASLSRSVAASITVVSFTGTDTSGTGIGAVGGASGVGAPSASIVTSRANSWVFAVGNDWDRAVARTLGPNQTMVHQYLATIGDTFWVQRQNATVQAAGTTVTINDTAPTTDKFNLSVVEILPAP